MLFRSLSVFIKGPPKPEKVYGMSFHKENKDNEKEPVPLKGKELQEAREFRTKVKAMYKVLSEVTLFLVFVLVLLVLCYGNRGSSRFTLNNSLDEALKNFKVRFGQCLYVFLYNFAQNFFCQERGSRSYLLLNSFNRTSIAVSHRKLRMDTHGWVLIQPF